MIRSLSLAVLLSSSTPATTFEVPPLPDPSAVPVVPSLPLAEPIPAPAATVIPDPDLVPEARAPTPDAGEILYEEMDLEGVLDRDVFLAGFQSVERRGLVAERIAIADMSQPSTERRLFVLDLATKELVLRTFVAHGSGTGGLMAEHFSNTEGSHQTSLGLYRVGTEIVSPKHGPALLLEGLDPGVNDLARAREIIVHGADYVSEAFIAQAGRLGRSWGCPAVPRADMAQVIDLLENDGFLYVHGA